jgi:hypothetical protein
MTGNEQIGADAGAGEATAAQRAIGDEHLRLEELIAHTELALSRDETDPEMLVVAVALRDAMEAHFEREESLYYPTLWALRPRLESALKKLIGVHQDFRSRLGALVETLERGDVEQAGQQLDEFNALFRDHEVAEERLLASLQPSEAGERESP